MGKNKLGTKIIFSCLFTVLLCVRGEAILGKFAQRYPIKQTIHLYLKYNSFLFTAFVYPFSVYTFLFLKTLVVVQENVASMTKAQRRGTSASKNSTFPREEKVEISRRLS